VRRTENRAKFIERFDALFTDREFFMRANGQVKFLKFPAKIQKLLALAVGISLLVWILATAAMAFNQISVQQDRLALLEKEAKVASSEERVAAYKDSIDGVAQDLSDRQDVLDETMSQYFGDNVELTESVSKDAEGAAPNAATSETEAQIEKNSKEISAAIPEAAALAKLEARQLAFASKLTRAAIIRTQRAEKAIRNFGLNPKNLVQSVQKASGGPFIPFFGDNDDAGKHPALERLNVALERMDILERSLSAIPSTMPADVNMMTSRYGYRRDPFTGRGAMHSGIDFKGPYGQPILAAADGVVGFAGWKSGYGKTVEINHENGLMTRYAHLSRIAVSAGQNITNGSKLGAMGSTGRSTGTHLHFEVRLHGRAINPRPFLEANTDVLKVQADARIRANAPKERTN